MSHSSSRCPAGKILWLLSNAILRRLPNEVAGAYGFRYNRGMSERCQKCFRPQANQRLLTLLSDPRYFPVLLYPASDAYTARSKPLQQSLRTKTLLALIIDATWFCSRKVIEHSPNLLALPKLSFYGGYRSIFTFKREPRPECISTIETCYYLIKELQSERLCRTDADAEPLMTVFKQMIKNQLQAENERICGLRPNTHANDWKYTKIKEIPQAVKTE